MASARYCLDSDVVIWHLRKGHHVDVSNYLENLAERGALMTTAVTVAEIEQGVRIGESEVTRSLLRSLDVIPIDRNIAERAGEIVRELRGRGVTLGLADALIAAACIIHDLSLVTLNVRHFGNVPGLSLEVMP